MALKLPAEDMRQNPYAVYASLRNTEHITTVQISKSDTALLVSRYDDAVAVLKDARFSVEKRKVTGYDMAKAWWTPHIFRLFLNSMALVDDPAHARLRGLVHKVFTPAMVQQMATRIESISSELLDKAAQQPVVDLIADYALPLPLTVISEMLGVPQEDRLKFRRWTTSVADATSSFDNLLTLLMSLPNAFLMNRFFYNLIRLRHEHPQEDDLISALIRANENGDALSDDEMLAMLFLVLFAGHETTVNLIGNGTLALLQHPDQLKKLAADPDLIDPAVEELLRFTNPVQQIAPRYALEDVELHGQMIPRGTQVLVNIASANRDESIFKDADQLDITRNPNRHIAFGTGIHYCLGAPLARLEGKIALNALLKRFPNIHLAVPVEQLEWRNSLSLRGLKAMPVHLK